MTNYIDPKKPSRGLLLAGMAALTMALVIGIKVFMSDDTASAPPPAADRQPLFKPQPAAADAPPGLLPAARPESGSGLEMFTKTNAGYYGEEESTATADAQKTAEPAVKTSTAPAVRKAAAAKRKTTVIPRMQPASFKGIAPSNVAPTGAGQGMPDISGMLKQAGQQTGNKDISGN
jgi:hypothetical protein